MATTTEPVLRSLEDSATFKVLVLRLNGKVHHGVNHMLKLVATGSLARLADLSDDDSIAEVFLAIISNHTQRSFGTLGVDVTIAVLTIIHALEAINNEEERLTRIGCPKGITLFEECRNVSFLTNLESTLKAKSFNNQLDLEEAFLSSVENDRRTRLGELISQGQHHRGLTRPGLTGEERTC